MLDGILNLKSRSFMNEDLSSNNIKYDQFEQNSAQTDYKKLITRLKEIKATIVLLEKTIFK